MLQIDGNSITYRLRPIENLGAFARSPRANISNLRSVRFEENPWTRKVLRGIRAPGAGFPYLILLGTMRHRLGKDFCVVYKRNPVLVLDFENESFKRWVIPANTSNLKSLAVLGFQLDI